MTEAVGDGPRDGGQEMIYPQVPQPSQTLARTEMARTLGRPRVKKDGHHKTQIEGPGCMLARKRNPGRPIQSHTVPVVRLRTGGNRDRGRLVFWGSHDVWKVAIRTSSTHILLPVGQTSPLQCEQCLAWQASSSVSGMVMVMIACSYTAGMDRSRCQFGEILHFDCARPGQAPGSMDVSWTRARRGACHLERFPDVESRPLMPVSRCCTTMYNHNTNTPPPHKPSCSQSCGVDPTRPTKT